MCQLVNLLEQQFFNLLQGLTVQGRGFDDECRVVMQPVDIDSDVLHLHFLQQINVDEACLPVIEHAAHDVERVALHIVVAFESPGHHQVFSVLAHDGGVALRRDLGLHGKFWTREVG